MSDKLAVLTATVVPTAHGFGPHAGADLSQTIRFLANILSWRRNFLGCWYASRRAYLHTDANVSSGSASAYVRIAQAGTYNVLLLYEALYRFETPVAVTVSQSGKQLFSRVYGYRSSPKVWGYPYAVTLGPARASKRSACGRGLDRQHGV
jgi:hypothetical protein